MANYTLNEFYFRAKAVIETLGAVDDEKSLNVSIEIEERPANKIPELKCSVYYRDKDYNKSIYGWGNTPNRALQEFEEQILKRQGKMLTERVSVDITDDLISKEN